MEWREKERQVWQRVLAPTAPDPGPDWQELLNQAAQSAGAYRYLAGALPGKRRETAGQLYRESLETLACLRGLCRLQGREPGRTQPVPQASVKSSTPRSKVSTRTSPGERVW